MTFVGQASKCCHAFYWKAKMKASNTKTFNEVAKFFWTLNGVSWICTRALSFDFGHLSVKM